MGRFSKEPEGGNYEQPPPGTHLAVCFRVIDLGTQHNEWQGEVKVANQVLVQWELLHEMMSDGQPFAAGKFYTNSLHEKATLRKDLTAWRGREFTPEELAGFDLKNIIGKPCLISVIATNKGKSKVSAVLAVPKGTPSPKPINPVQSFFLDEWDAAEFALLPKGIQAIIQKSDEYHAMMHGDAPDSDESPAPPEDSEIPF